MVLEKEHGIPSSNSVQSFQEITKQMTINNMIRYFQCKECHYVIKITFPGLPSRLFPHNFGDTNNEHGERFHQDISIMEK